MNCRPTAQCDRNLSPLKVSPKREFLRLRLETFGRFSPKLSIFGSLETSAICKNPRKLPGVRAKIDNNLRSSDCLAGAGGVEPPNGGIKIRSIPQPYQRHSELSRSVHLLTALMNFVRSECGTGPDPREFSHLVADLFYAPNQSLL